jgi:hypothetical protein
MAWLRLDDGLAGHPTIGQLTAAEFRVWLRVLCHCARHKRPTVDALTRGEVAGLTAKKIARFVELQLLDATGDTYEVYDSTSFQPKDWTAAARQARSRARRLEAARGGPMDRSSAVGEALRVIRLSRAANPSAVAAYYAARREGPFPRTCSVCGREWLAARRRSVRCPECQAKHLRKRKR